MEVLCRLRVVEHNVLVISKYYSRITTKRLATLLCLKEEEVSTVFCVHRQVCYSTSCSASGTRSNACSIFFWCVDTFVCALHSCYCSRVHFDFSWVWVMTMTIIRYGL